MSKQQISKKDFTNILIVDDIPANLQILSEILEREGHKVRPVLNGVMALQVAEKEKPDLILLDIMMPEMDGFEVCQHFKELPDLADVPIIFISALNDSNEIVKALHFGAADYITKPFHANEVTARVATHLKLYQQKNELQKINAEKDKFFSIIAHDLRSPFNSFLGLTEIMAEELPSLSLEQAQEIAKSMSKSANNLHRLLENLLQWSRMQQGAIPYNAEILQLDLLVAESIEMIYEPAKSKGIEIVTTINNDIKVLADPNMLQTVIRNLISNAVKFTQRDGKVYVSANVNADHITQISIQDTGIGMNRELLNNMFRIDVKTSRKGTDNEPSTGLGLLLCKEFVEKHGGRIWAESEEGKGSVFRFTIPPG
jgi:signal transduction histidine kinase